MFDNFSYIFQIRLISKSIITKGYTVLFGSLQITSTFLLRPCKTGKFSLRPYWNDYGN